MKRLIIFGASLSLTGCNITGNTQAQTTPSVVNNYSRPPIGFDFRTPIDEQCSPYSSVFDSGKIPVICQRKRQADKYTTALISFCHPKYEMHFIMSNNWNYLIFISHNFHGKINDPDFICAQKFLSIHNIGPYSGVMSLPPYQ